jgi:hypothetical protein
MKKILMISMVILGMSLFLASTARAEYAVSFTYSTGGGHLDRGHHDFGRRPQNPHNRGHFSRGYYFWPRPVVYRTEVVRVYETKPKEVILESRERLGISDIIVLSKTGVSDDAIIDKIAKTGSVFDLTVEEIEALRKEGVSSRVVNFMIDTKR